MRYRSFLPAIALLSLAACNPTTSPSSLIAGDWRTSPFAPSGSGIDLSLVANGSTVTGTGHQYDLMYLKYTFTIAGTLDIDPSTLSLTLTSDSGIAFRYTATVVGSDELQGQLTLVGCSVSDCQPQSLTFVRQPR